MSISFDRATDYYDRTRSISSEAMAVVTSQLTSELEGRSGCLEIGVGTGRIALPLSEAGVSMTGIDLSEPMLRKLLLKSDGRVPIPLALADATSLPFPDDSFDAGLACHVLHLVSDWRRTLHELARVVRPGGLILVDPGFWSEGWPRRLIERFADACGVALRPTGSAFARDIDAAMAELGAAPRRLPAVEDVHSASVSGKLGELEDGLYSFTWAAAPEARARVAAELRRWAQDDLGDLETPRQVMTVITWSAYDLPDRAVAHP
ncbi:MAG: class I SAM-dependent methyltransferase [Actinomycetota bacterium]